MSTTEIYRPNPYENEEEQKRIDNTIIAANNNDLNTVRENLKNIRVYNRFKRYNNEVNGETILIRLSDKGDVGLVKLLLENATPHEVNLKNINGNSAIILTGRNRNTEQAKEIINALLDKGADINDKNYSGENALILAEKYNTDLVEFLKNKIDEKHTEVRSVPNDREPKKWFDVFNKKGGKRKTKQRKSRKCKKSRKRT